MNKIASCKSFGTSDILWKQGQSYFLLIFMTCSQWKSPLWLTLVKWTLGKFEILLIIKLEQHINRLRHENHDDYEWSDIGHQTLLFNCDKDSFSWVPFCDWHALQNVQTDMCKQAHNTSWLSPKGSTQSCILDKKTQFWIWQSACNIALRDKYMRKFY